MAKKEIATGMEDLCVENVALVLEQWGLQEFVEFVKEKELDGRKLAVSIVCGRGKYRQLDIFKLS